MNEQLANSRRISAGASKAIYHRIIKKVYGRDAGLEVIKSFGRLSGFGHSHRPCETKAQGRGVEEGSA